MCSNFVALVWECEEDLPTISLAQATAPYASSMTLLLGNTVAYHSKIILLCQCGSAQRLLQTSGRIVGQVELANPHSP